MHTVETGRLILRPVTAADLPEIHRLLYADLDVAQWRTGLAGASLAQVEERWAR